MAERCLLCGAATVGETVPWLHFAHADFTPMPDTEVVLAECPACGLLFRQDGGAIDTLYRSKEYLRRKESSHAVLGAEGMVSPAAQQARLIDELAGPGDLALLDVGCHDGALLHALHARRPGWRLYGLDVIPGLEELHGASPPFEYTGGGLERLEGPFDLIVFSHSLQYLRDLSLLLRELHRLLAPQGRVMLQLPDLERKPLALLYGDLHVHYGERSLGALLARLGLAGKRVGEGLFPRDLLLLGVPGVPGEATPVTPLLPGLLRRVARLAEALESAAEGEGDLGVLGTTIEAAFAVALLGQRLTFCADENPRRCGRRFAGRPVLDPRRLDAGQRLLVPYGDSAPAIAERLGRHCRARLLPL